MRLETGDKIKYLPHPIGLDLEEIVAVVTTAGDSKHFGHFAMIEGGKGKYLLSNVDKLIDEKQVVLISDEEFAILSAGWELSVGGQATLDLNNITPAKKTKDGTKKSLAIKIFNDMVADGKNRQDILKSFMRDLKMKDKTAAVYYHYIKSNQWT